MNQKTINREKIREKIRLFLVELSGGCELQDGEDGKLWPCGTCINSILGALVDESDPLYSERNDPPDRINEIWRFILQMRDMKYKK